MDVRIKRMLTFAAAIVLGSQLAIKCSESEATLEERVDHAKDLAARHCYDDALEAYRRATNAFPNDPRAWVAYGDALLDLRCDARAADDAYLRGSAAGGADTAKAVALRRRGLLCWAGGRIDEAEAALRAASSSGDLPALRALALLLSCLHRPGAEVALAEGLRVLPNDPRLQVCSGAEAAAAGRASQARTLRDEGLVAARAAVDAPERAGDRWVRYLCARVDAALGERASAARCLAAAGEGLSATQIEDFPPLTRAEIAADPAFADPDPQLAAAIARCPARPLLPP